jgi:cytochrome c5
MQRFSKLIALLAMVALCSGTALAASGGNAKKGKYLFKKNCKTCHVAGAEGKAVTPLSKTQAQWDRFMDADKHKGKPQAWKEFSAQDLKDIQQFLFDHAADSDQPETCG